mmetsp:Transcript_24678/g.27467  ORF Transcript_24678/g.27467 Transcript_24678/m.27467 type:complete len:333 (+) Transcript_24678:46-1044(+)
MSSKPITGYLKSNKESTNDRSETEKVIASGSNQECCDEQTSTPTESTKSSPDKNQVSKTCNVPSRITILSSEDCVNYSGSPLLRQSEISLEEFPDATDEDLALLSGVKHLTLCNNNKITSTGLSSVCGVEILNLWYCPEVTDSGIFAIVKHLKLISMVGTSVTDKGVKAFKGIPTVSLQHSKLSGDTFSALSGVSYLDLYSAHLNNNGGISALTGIHTVDLTRATFTDECVAALAGVHTINLQDTLVTDKGVAALKGVHTISLKFCKRINGSCMKSLANAHTINISRTNARDDWILPLTGVHLLIMNYCLDVSFEAMQTVRNYGGEIECCYG